MGEHVKNAATIANVVDLGMKILDALEGDEIKRPKDESKEASVKAFAIELVNQLEGK